MNRMFVQRAAVLGLASALLVALSAVPARTTEAAPQKNAQKSKGKAKGKGVAVSDEMKDFMKMLNGTGEGTDAALKKHAAEKVDTLPMSSISLASPKVLKSEQANGQDCYTMQVQSGILVRTYLLCWKDKKIQSIKQLSME